MADNDQMTGSLQRISEMFQRCSGADPVCPPTELYNEGWMLRLIPDWQFKHKEEFQHFPFPDAGRWYSEALLPSPFLPRHKGDPLGEVYTHADGAIGDFKIGGKGAGDLVLSEEAQHFTILEAKMFSKLSPGVTHASYYNQAARTIACMAEVLCRADRKPESMKSMGFFVLAPREQIDARVFASQLERESIMRIVERRMAEYEGTKTEWFEAWFLPSLAVMQVGAFSWEELLRVVNEVDPRSGDELNSFYQRCLHYGKKMAGTEGRG